jgi:hypothetical protein
MVFAVVLLVLAGFAIAITIRPANIIALAITVYAFEQWTQANSAYFATHSRFMNVGFGALALYALGCTLLRGRNPITPVTPVMWASLALYAYAAGSCLWSIERGMSVFLFSYHLPYIVTFVGIVPLTIQDRDDLRQGFMMTLAFGTLVAILLLAGTQVHAWGRTVQVADRAAVVDRAGRFVTRLDPLSVASVGGQLVLVAVLLNFRGVGRVWQVLRWVLILMSFALIYRSGSRGQLIATLLTVVILITFSRGTKSATSWIAAGVSTFMILGFAIWTFLGFAGQNARWDLDFMTKEYSSTRIQYCVRLLDFWVNSTPMNWWFGLGSSASYDSRINGIYCHVIVVEVLTELGFMGLIMFATFAAFVLRDMVRLYALTKDSDVDRGVAVAVSALFIFSLIISLKQGSLLSNTGLFTSALMLSRHTAVTHLAYRREKAVDMRRRWTAYCAHFHQAGQTSSRS